MPSPSSRPGRRPSAGVRMTQADLAYGNLRHAIVSWQVEPGRWLTEVALQELSGFGRTPTREAAGRLIADGLLSLSPRNGYQVVDVDVADAEALFDVWETLAPMTGRLAAGRVDDTAMSLLRELAAGTIPATPDGDALIDLTEVLFDATLRATGNAWLQSVGAGIFHHLLRLSVLAYRTEPNISESFSLMLAALESEDPAVGEKAFATFTASARRAIISAVRGYVRNRLADGLGEQRTRTLPS